MKIYVGRWDLLLAAEEEFYRPFREMDSWDVAEELSREIREYDKTHEVEDNLMGVYTPEEFEDTFNQDLEGKFNTKEYWIKIF